MKIISQHRLANDMLLTVYNQSKKMAGDRWLLRVVCEAEYPVADEFFADFPDDAPGLKGEIYDRMAGVLKFSVVKEKTFVDHAESDVVLAGMVAEISGNMAGYIGNPAFPERLFSRSYEALKQECIMARHYSGLESGAADEKEDEGPADFSECFRDD